MAKLIVLYKTPKDAAAGDDDEKATDQRDIATSNSSHELRPKA